LQGSLPLHPDFNSGPPKYESFNHDVTAEAPGKDWNGWIGSRAFLDEATKRKIYSPDINRGQLLASSLPPLSSSTSRYHPHYEAT
jgi:hypothetical protein